MPGRSNRNRSISGSLSESEHTDEDDESDCAVDVEVEWCEVVLKLYRQFSRSWGEEFPLDCRTRGLRDRRLVD